MAQNRRSTSFQLVVHARDRVAIAIARASFRCPSVDRRRWFGLQVGLQASLTVSLTINPYPRGEAVGLSVSGGTIGILVLVFSIYLSSMKNLLTVVFIFAAAAGLSSAVEPECDAENASSSSSTKIRIGLEWFLNPDHLPLVVALRMNLFLDFGLDVELVEPKDHWEAELEILEGRLDVAVTEPLHLAQDAAKNKPVLGFSRFLHTDGGVLYV